MPWPTGVRVHCAVCKTLVTFTGDEDILHSQHGRYVSARCPKCHHNVRYYEHWFDAAAYMDNPPPRERKVYMPMPEWFWLVLAAVVLVYAFMFFMHHAGY